MATARLVLGGLFFSAAMLANAESVQHQVTPVQKVTELLKKLEAQVKATGKEEAAQYDKFACFCKEQADNKLYAIEKSDELIKMLDAEISKLGTDLSGLTTDLGKLSSKINNLDGKLKSNAAKNKRRYNGYKQVDDEVQFCIGALENAIKAVEGSKGQLSDAKLDFQQLTAMAESMVHTSSRSSIVQKLSFLQKAVQEPASYEFRSNDILATLQQLLITFKDNKKQLDEEEFESKAAFDKKQLNFGNAKKFAEKEKREKEEVESAKTAEKQEHTKNRIAENNARNADDAFLQELTSACQTKATEWDARSGTRADEIKVLNEAIKMLEEGVVPNSGANSKLTGLQRKVIVKTGHWVYVDDAAATPKTSVSAPKALSFLQLRGNSRDNLSAQAAALQKAMGVLSRAATQQRSPVLSALVLKASAVDHFAKVRAMIRDLVERLQTDANNEQNSKTYCDTEMGLAMTKRDTEQVTVESKTAAIAAKEAELAETVEDIATLSKEIAEANKAKLEATELRQDASVTNKETIRQANAGLQAVQNALQILKDFYNDGQGLSASFLGYTPPNADRSGKTVSDLAPKSNSQTYTGSQGAGQNIIGVLEVIESDFDRTEQTTETTEDTDQSDYESLKSDLESDISTKNGQVNTKTAHVTTLKDDITDLTDDKMTAEKNLSDAEKMLETLKPMCVEGEETWDERTAAREKEIEALKEAQNILENWQ